MLGGRLPEWTQCPFCDHVFKRKGFVGRSGKQVQCPCCNRRFYIWEAKELFITDDNYFKPIPVFKSQSKRAKKTRLRLKLMKERHESLL